MKETFRSVIRKFYHQLVEPKNTNDDKKRKEFILNILIVSSEVLMTAILLLSFIREVVDIVSGEDRGFNPAVFLIMGAVFVLAHYLSRKGKIKLASFIFLSIFFIPNLYLSYHWGVDLPQSLLLYAFTILASGILIGTRFSIIITFFIGTYLCILGYFQGCGTLTPNTYWATEMVTFYDIIPIFITLLIMATISWLSNREIENSLSRALESEKYLKLERDNLEITVENRTKELQKMQMDKIGQLYRLAEFGRISSGIFHDLISPLTAISINLEQLSEDPHLRETSKKVEQAVLATKRMKTLVESVKKQLKNEECRKLFSINNEIKETLSLLEHRAICTNTILKFRFEKEIEMFGNPLKFSQIILNLVANSLDELADTNRAEKHIHIKLTLKRNDMICIIVKDNGSGINKDLMNKIFDPFFSTKNGKGLGLGLSSTKHLVEKEFKGTIGVKNLPEGGCAFSIILPNLKNSL